MPSSFSVVGVCGDVGLLYEEDEENVLIDGGERSLATATFTICSICAGIYGGCVAENVEAAEYIPWHIVVIMTLQGGNGRMSHVACAVWLTEDASIQMSQWHHNKKAAIQCKYTLKHSHAHHRY